MLLHNLVRDLAHFYEINFQNHLAGVRHLHELHEQSTYYTQIIQILTEQETELRNRITAHQAIFDSVQLQLVELIANKEDIESRLVELQVQHESAEAYLASIQAESETTSKRVAELVSMKWHLEERIAELKKKQDIELNVIKTADEILDRIQTSIKLFAEHEPISMEPETSGSSPITPSEISANFTAFLEGESPTSPTPSSPVNLEDGITQPSYQGLPHLIAIDGTGHFVRPSLVAGVDTFSALTTGATHRHAALIVANSHIPRQVIGQAALEIQLQVASAEEKRRNEQKQKDEQRDMEEAVVKENNEDKEMEVRE
ncbi:hypothetical protein HDU93_008476 [Gonapodya sp. JEL0774]|nr:hypothetical protein HDU93_008476 [Gonapodya sp. JEL0774]